MRVTLSLTHRCNLACQYCYGGKAYDSDMSYGTAREIVDFVMPRNPPGRTLQVQFFGGEPLLCFDRMEEIVAYLRQQASDRRVRVSLSVTTNGTLLNQRILDYLRNENVDLCISLDGPAPVHDLNRRYNNGRGSFSVVEPRLREALAALGQVQVNAVYGPDTIDSLPQSVRFLVDIGVPVIHLNPNIGAVWPANFAPRLNDSFAKIAEDYIAWYEQGREIAVNVIDSKIVLFAKGGYSCDDQCCMGEGELAFAPSGNIYSCERFIGEDGDSPFCIGNVRTGLDTVRRRVVDLGRGNRSATCHACPWKRYCMNWCGCTNYYMTGRTDMAGAALCAIEQAVITAARHVALSRCARNDELLARHFTGYFHGDPRTACPSTTEET